MAELYDLVVAGPDPEKHQVVRWRCVDVRKEVSRRFSVTVDERTIGKWLRKLKLTRLQPRPYHPKVDEAAQETFKKLQRYSEASAAQHDRGHTSRGLVPG